MAEFPYQSGNPREIYGRSTSPHRTNAMQTAGLRNVFDRLRTADALPEALRQTDGQLLDRYVAGRDDIAFEALVRRHGPMVQGVCRRLLVNPSDADDAFQATFLVLVRKAPSVFPREKIASWLYGVADRAAQKAGAVAARRRVRERQVETLPEPTSVADGLWHDLLPLLDQELSRLPDKYRLPLVLCDLEGHTRSEAAEHLRWPEGTVAGRLVRARSLLTRRMSRYGLPLSAGVLTAVFSQNAACAGVQVALIESTCRAAATFAARAASGVVSEKVLGLTTGVLQTMLRKKIKLAGAAILLAILAMGVAGTMAYRAWARSPALPAPQDKPHADAKKSGQTEDSSARELRALEGEWKVVAIETENRNAPA